MNLDRLKLENDMHDIIGQALNQLNDMGLHAVPYDQREADLEGIIHRTFNNVLVGRSSVNSFNIFVEQYKKHIITKGQKCSLKIS